MIDQKKTNKISKTNPGTANFISFAVNGMYTPFHNYTYVFRHAEFSGINEFTEKFDLESEISF